MKKSVYLLFCAAVLAALIGCTGMSEQEKAAALLQQSRTLYAEGKSNSARLLLDSINATYPKQVETRRQAKALEDTIRYDEASRTVAYADSLLVTLMPQADELLKKFRYEKNEQYEDAGRYVHRLLTTGSNTSRCFLQACVTDTHISVVKSYYFGQASLDQTAVELSSGGETTRMEGHSHVFEAEGWHSLMTFEQDKALGLLNFISSHCNDRIKVTIYGMNRNGAERSTAYFLTDTEKQALQDTYQLGLIMNDIRQLEDMQKKGRAVTEKFEKKYML